LATQPQATFVSYSRDDSDFALRLTEDLKSAGASVWLDQLDIQPGQRWARAVQDALTASPRMLVILSPSSVESTNVDDEISFALEEHKTVIPVLYRECKVPFRLRPFQYIDFRTDYSRALEVLLNNLGVKQPPPSPPSPSPPPPPPVLRVPPVPTRFPAWAKVAIAVCGTLIIALVLHGGCGRAVVHRAAGRVAYTFHPTDNGCPIHAVSSHEWEIRGARTALLHTS
jgi:hypothetical protein